MKKYRDVVDRQPVALRMLGRLAQMGDVCIGVVGKMCVEVQSWCLPCPELSELRPDALPPFVQRPQGYCLAGCCQPEQSDWLTAALASHAGLAAVSGSQ